ncbi:hypothetical protein RUND412_005357 [Rhizina undulata]
MTSTTKPPLSTLLPKIVLGGGVYNTQMNASPSDLPIPKLISRAFTLGITAIDTSPYYGPSESLIGTALSHPTISSVFPRESYILMTKVGRIAGETFDYSPAWVRKSIQRSLERLNTEYLDVVFCHDVEFVTTEEMIGALQTLWELQNAGVVRYVGISGYPPQILAERAVKVRETEGRTLDIVQSYGHFNLQNSRLKEYLHALKNDAGVDCIINSSPLGMKLLTGTYPGDFHPAPKELQVACGVAAEYCGLIGETLPKVAMRWAFAKWLELAAENGGGITVSGASYVEELEGNVEAFREVVVVPDSHTKGIKGLETVDEGKVGRLEEAWSVVEERLGQWRDWSWDSPPIGWWERRSESTPSTL